MPNYPPAIVILLNALKGAAITLFGLIILATIFALPYGGPLILLYYWVYVVFYALPLGLLLGATLGLFSIFPITSEKNKRPYVWSVVAILLIFGAIFAYIAFPYVTIDKTGYVEHSATWFYIDIDDSRLPISAKERETCDIEVVLFRLESYSYLDAVCDQAVLDYLDTVENENVRLTYRVTYDFGEPRAYQLISVGPVLVTWDTWVASWNGCGGRYAHPCSSERAQSERVLLESSWSVR